jgi:TusA-related sulfurtransferase
MILAHTHEEKNKKGCPMKNVKPDATLDITNTIAPVTVLKVESRLGSMACGQVLEVFCADRETKTDLCSIAKNAGHCCQAVERPSSIFRLLIRKG